MAARSKAARVRKARRGARSERHISKPGRKRSDPVGTYLQQLRGQRDQLDQYITAAESVIKLLHNGPRIPGLNLAFNPRSLALPTFPMSASPLRSSRMKLAPSQPPNAHQLAGAKPRHRARALPQLCLLCEGPVRGKRIDKKFCRREHTSIYNSAQRRGPAALKRAIEAARATPGRLPDLRKVKVKTAAKPAPVKAAATDAAAPKKRFSLRCEYGGHPFQAGVTWARFCGPKHKLAFYAEQRAKGLDPVRYSNRSEAQKHRVGRNGNGASHEPEPEPKPVVRKTRPTTLVPGDQLSTLGQPVP